MPDVEFWKIAVSLGVPGLALGVFYMLFRTFNWNFPSVPKKFVAPIIVIFMLLTTGVILTALILWAPSNQSVSPQEVRDARVWMENLRLAYSPIPGGGSGGPNIPTREFIAKDPLLEMLKSLNLSNDTDLQQARDRIIAMVEAADDDSFGDIDMSRQLKQSLENLRIGIRNKAVEYGVDVRGFPTVSQSGGGFS